MRILLRRTGDPGSIRRLAVVAAGAAVALLAAACGGSQPHSLAVGTVADTGTGAGASTESPTGGVAPTTEAGDRSPRTSPKNPAMYSDAFRRNSWAG